MPLGVHHRDGVALLDHLCIKLAIHLEDALRQIQHVLLFILAIRIGWSQREVKLVTHGQVLQGSLESGEHHAHAIDKLEGSLDCCLLHQLAFVAFTHVEVVSDRHVFVRCNIHVLYII